MNKYLTKNIQNKIQQRGETNGNINQGVKYMLFIASKLQGLSFKSKLGSYSRFQKC